jgi:hypothetical protein
MATTAVLPLPPEEPLYPKLSAHPKYDNFTLYNKVEQIK